MALCGKPQTRCLFELRNPFLWFLFSFQTKAAETSGVFKVCLMQLLVLAAVSDDQSHAVVSKRFSAKF